VASRWGQGSVFKRGRIYWIQYYRRGKGYSESSHSDKERVARRLLRRRLAVAASPNFVGPSEERLTFEDLRKGLLDDYRIKGNRTSDLAALAFRRLGTWFANDRFVDITSDRIKAYSARRLDEGLSASSINYDLAVLRRSFNVMKQAGRLTTIPHVTMLPSAEPRQGFLDPPEFARLRGALPEYLRDPIRFLYLSGWRVGEMRSLMWSDVDLPSRAIRLRPENSKTKTGRVLKLGGELLELFVRADRNRQPDCLHVFHRDGQPIGAFRKTWRTACRSAGLGGTLVHDMRRSSIRNMIRAGVPERVAMAVSGHKTRTIFARYDIVDEGDLDLAATRIDEYVAERQNDAPKVVPLRGRA
jgi:integrase